MFRRFYRITGLLMLLTFVPTLAENDLPPPLGYASLNEYDERYHVYDFKTHAVQTVERAVPLGENINDYGSSTPPALVKLQSPYNPLIQFEFESTQTPEPNEHIDYNLYRRVNSHTRQLIAQHADVTYPEKDYWSPNGAYLYVKTDTQPSGAGTLSRLDLHTNQLTRLTQPVWGLENCHTNGAWCVVIKLGVRDGEKYPVTLYVLDRDEGTLQTLGTSVLIFTNNMWLGTGSDLLYAVAPTVDHYAVHRYDAVRQVDERVAEIQATFISSWRLSPDSRWLIVEASLSKGISGGLYALDLKSQDATPLLLTKQFVHLSQSPVTSLHWVDDHTLIYSTYDKHEGHSIDRVSFPTGEIRELAHFDKGINFFDHDWSPDGHWLILSESETTAALPKIDLISMDGESRQIKLPITEDQPVCVGWFSQEIYLSQKANLCDMTLGEG